MLKRSLLSALLLSFSICIASAQTGSLANSKEICSLDFEGASIDGDGYFLFYHIDGNNCKMNLANVSTGTGGTGYQLGYNGTEELGKLRVGQGDAIIDFGGMEIERTDIVKISFDFYWGMLVNKHAGFFLNDVEGKPIASFYYSPYSNTTTNYGTYSGDVFDIMNVSEGDGDEGSQWVGGVGSSTAFNVAIAAETNRTHIEIFLDYKKGEKYMTFTHPSKGTHTTKILPLASDIIPAQFILRSTYNNPDRRSWFDNFKLTEEVEDDNIIITPEDYTSYITNPSFETGNTSGWTVNYSVDTGAKPNSSSTFHCDNADGNYLFNIWDKGNPITQTITGLPNGIYEVSALLTSDDNCTNVYLLANYSHKAVTLEKNPVTGSKQTWLTRGSMIVKVTNGTLIIGAVGSGPSGFLYSENGDNRWYKADDFRLNYLGNDEAANQYWELHGDDKAEPITDIVPGTDITDKVLQNVDFSYGFDGWSRDHVVGGNVVAAAAPIRCAEGWNNADWDIYQVVKGLPEGYYSIQIQGFYRRGRDVNAWNYYFDQNGEKKESIPEVPAFVYLNDYKSPLMYVFDYKVPVSENYYIGDYYTDPLNGFTYPNNMTDAGLAFDRGAYIMKAGGLVKEGETMRIGVKGSTTQDGDSWAIFTRFKLIYQGKYNAEEMKPLLRQQITELEKVIGNIIGNELRNEANDLLTEAKDLLTSDNGEAIFNSIEAVKNIIQKIILEPEENIVDDAEWNVLQTLNSQLSALGWETGWDFTKKSNAKSFTGITLKDRHVDAINFSNKALTGELPAAIQQLPELTSLNLSYNKLTGNIGAFVAPMTKLRSLDASHNNIADLLPYLSTNITSANVDYQTIVRQFDLDVAHINLTLLMQIPTIMLNLYSTTSDVVFYFMPSDGNNFSIGYKNGTFSVSGSSTIYVKSGEVVDITTDNHIQGMTMKLSYPIGDTDLNGAVDIADVQRTINYIFGETQYYMFHAGDTYKDEVINVQDVIASVNLILGNQSSAKGVQPTYSITEEATEEDAPEAHIYIEGDKVMLQSDKAVSALQLQAYGDIDWNLGQYGLSQATSDSKLVAYSLMGFTIPAGTNVIGTCHNSASIESAKLVDANADNIFVKISDDQATGLYNINGASMNEDAEIYSPAGIKRNSLGKGINIIRKNGYETIKTTK